MIDGIRSSAGAPRRREKSTIRSSSTRLFAMVVKSGVVCGAQRRMCGLARDVEIAKNATHRSSGMFTITEAVDGLPTSCEPLDDANVRNVGSVVGTCLGGGVRVADEGGFLLRKWRYFVRRR